MTVEPGWYYAQGDPAGTVRHWNGAEWQGEPQPDPGAAAPEIPGYEVTGYVATQPQETAVAVAEIAPATMQQTERGFYHAPGDPAGTVRLWNGSEWVGFPVRDPNMSSSEISTVGVKPFAPVPGQTKLAGVAILTQVVLILLAGTHLFLAYAMFDLSSAVGDSASFETTEATGSVLQFGAAFLIQIVASLIAGVVFIIWFFMAYRNMSLWHRPRRGLYWTVIVWFVPFVNIIRPMSMMLELLERSPRDDRRGETNPVLGMAWWLLWLLPGSFAQLVASAGGPEDAGKNLLQASGVAMLLNAVSIIFAIVLVQKITDHQDSRFRPTAAQRELMKRDAEILALKQAESTGIA